MPLDDIDLENQRVEQILRFSKLLALIATVVAAIPCLIGWLTAPVGSLYLGIQTNLDDHMVYAAWMRQAMEGRFLFDNRFAVDPQPGLTVHVYFYVLGLIAKVLGIPVTMAVVRLFLTYVFVRVFARFLIQLKVDVFSAKFILMIGCFGGGLGFLAWETFGQDIVSGPEFLKSIFGTSASIDVWQPEAFVFPSMLTNGLFLVSLCLIVTVLQAVIDAKDSWKSVLGGAVAYGVLMNIHSYDVLLIGLVLVGFLATQLVRRQVSLGWVLRTLCIICGALPAAVWFLYVLQNDPVFQARAATLTFSAGFRPVLLGIFPPLVLAALAIWKFEGRWRLAGSIAFAVLIVSLLLLSANYQPTKYMLEPVTWMAIFALGVGTVALLSSQNDDWNIAVSWAIMGTVAIYFPALFQRKLAMGLIVPWAMLAAVGLKELLKNRDRSTRNLVATLTLFVSCASSIRWFQREIQFVRNDVGRTAVHPVYFSQDTKMILDYLNKESGRRVVVSMPGVWNPVGPDSPGEFKTPIVPDLNAILSGLAGVYTYAGHWSETPDYNKRRARATMLYLATTTSEQRAALLEMMRPDYVVAPNTGAFPEVVLGDQRIPLADLTSIGTVVYNGNQFLLIKVNH